MAVFKKTYFTEPETTQLLDPTIALGVIYDLSRSGTDLQETVEQTDTPPNGFFSYWPDYGYIFFNKDTPFMPGEWVTIIYKAIGIPIPPPPEPPEECPVPVVTLEMTAPGVVRVRMATVGNYRVEIILGVGLCGDSPPLQSATITGGDSYISSPLPEGSYKACVRRDCGGGMLSAAVQSNTVAIVIPPINFGVKKDPSDTEIKILSVSGFPYEIRSGSFPLVTGGQELLARHEAFTTSIVVVVQVKKKQNVVVSLYKNGPLVQYLVGYRTTPGNVTLTFTATPILSTDNIYLLLGYS